MSHQHITDLAAYALASAGMATAILPPDHGALGAAAIGGIIGGFISVALVPEAPTETRRTIGAKWAVSSLTSITTTPFLFQRWTQPTVDKAGEVITPLLANTAESMLALSTAVALLSWITLRLVQAAYGRWLGGYLDTKLPAPPKRRETDRHKDSV